MIADAVALMFTLISLLCAVFLHKLVIGMEESLHVDLTCWRFLLLGTAIVSGLLIAWDIFEALEVIPVWAGDWRKVTNRGLDALILCGTLFVVLFPRIKAKLENQV